MIRHVRAEMFLSESGGECAVHSLKLKFANECFSYVNKWQNGENERISAKKTRTIDAIFHAVCAVVEEIIAITTRAKENKMKIPAISVMWKIFSFS